MARNGRLELSSMIIICILIFQFSGFILQASSEGHCVWYGVCSKPSDGVRARNCFYGGPALPIQSSTRYIIQKYCPDIAAAGVSCCDEGQLRNMQTNIMLIENILASSPTCFQNFMHHICGLTCSTSQSNFIKPVRLTPFNSTHQRVENIDFFLSTTYMDATFESCSKVRFTDPSGESLPALDFMCGDHLAAECTPPRWFQSMYDVSNPFVPFQINVISGNEPVDGYVPFNPIYKSEKVIL